MRLASAVRRIFTGIVRDITDFKKAIEERLRLVNELEGERALLNSLLDNAPVGFGFFDHKLRYLRLNPAMAEMNGVPMDAHLGRSLVEVLPNLSAEVAESFTQVLQSGQSIVNRGSRRRVPRGPGEQGSLALQFLPR